MTIPTIDWAGLACSQIWQVTALAVIAGSVARLVGRRRPHLAYVLWMLVILKCLTPPLWSSPTGVFSWAQARTAAPTADVSEIMPSQTFVETPLAEPSRQDIVKLPEFGDGFRRHLPNDAAEPMIMIPAPAVEQPRWSWTAYASDHWPMILAGVWLLGLFVLAVLFVWKWLGYRRIVRRLSVPADAAIESLAAQIGRQLGLRRPIRVRITTAPIGPAVFGWLRPVVLLPESLVAGALRVPPPDPAHGVCGLPIEPILAHEIVHIRRGDHHWGLLQLAAEALWWFHPLVWWANRELCRARERCCDEEVVAGVRCRPAAYARCLLDVLELERNWRPMLSVPGVRSKEVTQKRLEDIMSRSNRFHARTPRWSWAFLAIAAALVLPGGAMVLGQNGQNETATLKEQEPKEQEPKEQEPKEQEKDKPNRENTQAATGPRYSTPSPESPDPQRVKANQEYLLLPAEVPVTVLVVNAEGRPVKDAEVLAWNRADEIEYHPFHTDERGHATIPWDKTALDRVFCLFARHGDNLGWHGSQPGPDIAVETIKKPIKMTLFPRSRTIEGVCVDAKVQPVAGAFVYVDGIVNDANGGLLTYIAEKRLGSVVSDAQGRYSIKVPECKGFRLIAKHPKFVVVEHSSDPNSKPGRLVLSEPAGTIQGQVVNAATGKPIRGAIIHVLIRKEREPGETTFRLAVAVSDENGRYRLQCVVPGIWNVVLLGVPGNRELTAAAVEGVEVKAGEPAAADFRVVKGRRLSGRVIDAVKNVPLAGVSVGYYGAARPRSGAACLTVNTDANGQFEFYVPPGESFVYVADSFKSKRSSMMLMVEPDKNPAPIVFKGVLTDPLRTVENQSSQYPVTKEAEEEEKITLPERDKLAYTLCGTFHTFDGKPVHLARILVRSIDGKSGWSPSLLHSGNEFQIYLGKSLYLDGKGGRDLEKERLANRDRIGKPGCLLVEVPGYARPKPVEFTFEKDIKPVVVNLERPTFVAVRGRAIDEKGNPAVDANVAVSLSTVGDATEEPWGPEYLTGPDGRFELKHVYVGCRFAVCIEKGNQLATTSPLTLKDDAAVDLGDVQLRAAKDVSVAAPTLVLGKQPRRRISAVTGPHTVVAGQIVDAAGKGIPAARVAFVGRLRHLSAESLSLLRGELTLLGATTADTDGRFEWPLPKLSSSAFLDAHLVAKADGHNLGLQSIDLDVERPRIVLALAKETAIHGRVVDADGKPAAGVKVHVTCIGKSLPGDDFDSIQCCLPPLRLPLWPRSATTDGEGRFTLRGVDRSGLLNVQVRDDRFAIDWIRLGKAGEKDAHVSESPSGEVTIAPPPARIYEGAITYEDTHRPAANARVEIGSTEEFPSRCIMNMAGRTDAAGRFRLNPNSGKIFFLTVYPPDGEPYLIYEKRIDLADGQQPPKIEIALPRGVLLRGKITEKASGSPVAGAGVKYEELSRPYYRPDRTIPDYTPRDVRGVSRADGTYQIAVPPGSGVLFVQGPHNDYIRQTINTWDFNKKATWAQRHYAAAYASLDLKPDQKSAEQNIAIRRGATVRGRIVGPDNQPAGDVRILSRHFISVGEDTWGHGGGSVRVKNGQFELHGLDPDVATPFYFLDPKNETGATVEISGRSADAGPLVVHLQPCGRAVARFVTPEGKPKAKYDPLLLILASPGPSFTNDTIKKKAIPADQDFVSNFDREHYWDKPHTDDKGRCTFPALIPGATYRLPVSNEIGQFMMEKDFTVKSGETLQLPDIAVPDKSDTADDKSAQEFEQHRQRVEKNLASKNPSDVGERGCYYMQNREV